MRSGRAGFGVPDVAGVFEDGAVAGEFAGAGDVEDGFADPVVGFLVELADAGVGLGIGGEVGEVHVEIAAVEERIAQGFEDAGLEGVEMIGEDQVEGVAGFGFVGWSKENRVWMRPGGW